MVDLEGIETPEILTQNFLYTADIHSIHCVWIHLYTSAYKKTELYVIHKLQLS
jgi:hypothetical protein